LRGAAQQSVAANQQQLGSIDVGCRLAAYSVGRVGPGQCCCWPLNADPLGRKNIDSLDTFALLSELAIALMGFAGVVAAFAGRDRTYAPVEKKRLKALFQTGGIVLIGSLAVPSLSSAGLANSATFRIVSMAVALCMVGLTIFSMPDSVRDMRDPDTTTTPWVTGINVAMLLCIISLFAADALWIGEAWPLLSGFSILLIHGVWVWALLLTRRN